MIFEFFTLMKYFLNFPLYYQGIGGAPYFRMFDVAVVKFHIDLPIVANCFLNSSSFNYKFDIIFGFCTSFSFVTKKIFLKHIFP